MEALRKKLHPTIEGHIPTTELGDNALHIAASLGDIKYMEELIYYYNISIESKNLYSTTPLYNAIIYKQVDAINYLLDRGALTNVISTLSGKSCYDRAREIGLPIEVIRKINFINIRDTNYPNILPKSLQKLSQTP